MELTKKSLENVEITTLKNTLRNTAESITSSLQSVKKTM